MAVDDVGKLVRRLDGYVGMVDKLINDELDALYREHQRAIIGINGRLMDNDARIRRINEAYAEGTESDIPQDFIRTVILDGLRTAHEQVRLDELYLVEIDRMTVKLMDGRMLIDELRAAIRGMPASTPEERARVASLDAQCSALERMGDEANAVLSTHSDGITKELEDAKALLGSTMEFASLFGYPVDAIYGYGDGRDDEA